MRDYLPLVGAWLAYGVWHSYLAAPGVKAWVGRHWPGLARRYRLYFNLMALLCLWPVWLVQNPLHGPLLWERPWWLAALLNVLALGALWGAWQTAKVYNMREFLGLRPAQAGPVRFSLSYWHRWVRHPWYFFALILVWTRPMDGASLVSALCISAYFVLGSRLEEQKLLAELGAPYRRYQALVPGLWPWPGRVLSAAQAQSLCADAQAAPVSAKGVQ